MQMRICSPSFLSDTSSDAASESHSDLPAEDASKSCHASKINCSAQAREVNYNNTTRKRVKVCT